MKSLKHIDTKILKEMESGKWKNSYLVYNRKSTDEPENQKNSIAYQKSENLRFAFREHLSIAKLNIEGFSNDGIVSEKHSAFKEDIDLTFSENGLVQYRVDRPKFYKLIQLLNQGYFKGVIVLCWDRISRNKGDETLVRKLMKSGVDFRFVLATYDKTSAGALHMDIDGMFAEHHSRVTSEKVSLNIFNQREKGICTYKAPVGYLNIGRMDYKPIDEERAPLIKKFFELYATGEWSLSSLVKFANDQGFTMSLTRRKKTREEKQIEEENDTELVIEPTRRIITRSRMQEILTNQFYTGKIIGNHGKLIQSNSHKPIISEELFNKVQLQLRKRNISVKYSTALNYPLRGVIRCENCKRVYTPYEKKGILYFGVRCLKNCTNPNKNFNITLITTSIGKLIKGLVFTENDLQKFNEITSTDIALFETKRFEQLEVNNRQKKKLREDLAYLRENRLSLLKAGVFSPESLIEEENKIIKKIEKLQEEEKASDSSMTETFKDVVILSELLEKVYGYYNLADSFEKQEIIKIVFSELSVFQNEVKYKCKNGFQALQSRFDLSCAPQRWLSEIPCLHKEIECSIRELELIP